MPKKQKSTKQNASKASLPKGAFGSGAIRKQFISRKRILILAPILVVGVGAYVVLANNYFDLLGTNADVEKGLIYATETEESPAATTPVSAPEGQLPPTPTPSEEAEASVEGESTDTPVETNQLPENEEKAVEDAARVNTEVDSHEVEVMGGDN